jgi:phosphoribosylpyrophosphate synthetase
MTVGEGGPYVNYAYLCQLVTHYTPLVPQTDNCRRLLISTDTMSRPTASEVVVYISVFCGSRLFLRRRGGGSPTSNQFIAAVI